MDMTRIARELEAPLGDTTPGAGKASGRLSLSEVLSRAEVGILHRDMQGHIISVNDRFCSITGRSAKELDGLPWEAFTHPDDVAKTGAIYRRHLARAEPVQVENRYLRPDGTISWCIVHVSFVCDEAGRPVATVAVALDVTDRRHAEEELRESEEHFRYTIELSPQISWTARPDGSIEAVSPRWAERTHMPVQDAMGDGWIKAINEEDVAPTVAAWREALLTRRPIDIEYRLKTRGDGYRWYRARAAPRIDEQGNVVRWYGTLEDVDDHKRAEQALRESEERFRLAAHAAGLGIWDFDVATGKREWSDQFKEMLGLPADTPPDLATAMGVVAPEDRYKLNGVIETVQVGGKHPRFDVTIRIHRADNGQERILQTGGWRIEAPSGRLERVLVTIRDVTEEHNAEQRIRWTANHDALTGMPNRSCFTTQLNEAIARAEAEKTRLALILFDVDNLKETNDTIGHHAGDLLLRTFAQRLRANLPDEACIGRIGGDEFAVFMPFEDEARAIATVRSAVRALRTPFLHEEQSLDCQATAGASIFPTDGRAAPDLLRAADISLYVGKAGKRGSLTIFQPEMRADIQRRSSILAVARAAVRDDRIMPFYQPKVTLADRRIIGFEALLRWQDRILGIQHPDTIASAFEDLNLATGLGARMLRGICRDMRRWMEDGLEIGSVAINLSPAEFRRDDLFDRIMEQLTRAAIPASMIELEVTETVFLGRGAEAVGATLSAFHDQGMRIALDDFGTGYASLTHLQSFPVDVIKIDRSFVSNVCTRPSDAAIIDAVIGLAGRLNMDVVAEGIETPQQAAHLAAQGCTYGQGFLFGRAVPPSDVAALLRAANPPLPPELQGRL